MSVKSLKTGTRTFSMLAGNTPEHHVLIAESTVGAGGTSTITFSNIPADYKHLHIRGIVKNTGTASYNTTKFTFNGDTANNYSQHDMYGGGGTFWSEGVSPYGNIFLNTGSSQFGPMIIDILDYADTSKFKTVRALSGSDNNGSNKICGMYSGNWRSSDAITSISFSDFSAGTLAQYTTISLYGVK